MKKNALVVLIVALVLTVFGFGCMAVGLGGWQYRAVYGGWSLYYGGAVGVWGISRMIFGSALFLGGILLIGVSVLLDRKEPRREAKPEEAVKAQAVDEPKPEAKA